MSLLNAFNAAFSGNHNESSNALPRGGSAFGGLQDFGAALAVAVTDITGDFGDGFDVIHDPPKELKPHELQLKKHDITLPNTYSEFKWSPLEPGEHRIRLVTITRDQPNQDKSVKVPCNILPVQTTQQAFRCEINHVKLSACPQFDAVSYTWLDFGRNIPISVDGKQVLYVNASLYACLQYLLASQEKLVLWWDQICIDQASEDEKSSQVLLMSKIFAMARRTIVWLGEADPDTDRALSTLNKLYDLEKHPTAEVSTRTNATAKARLMVQEGFTNAKSEASMLRTCVGRLLNRPWFERAWIHQEATMAKDAVIMIGARILQFEPFCEAVITFCEAEQDQIRDFSTSLTTNARGYNTLRAIQQGRRDVRSNRHSSNESLQNILCRLAGAVKTKLDHDLIYAFLAFQSIEVQPLRVDYSLSTAKAYNLAAKSLIQQTRNLDIFGIIGDRSRLPELASWAPDWSQRLPQGHPILQSGIQSAFEACGRRNHNFVPQTESEKLLQVQGKNIDLVEQIHMHNFDTRERNKGNVERFLQLAKQIEFLKSAQRSSSMNNRTDAQNWGDRKRMLKVLLADGAFRFSPLHGSETLATHCPITDLEMDFLLQIYNNEASVRKGVLPDVEKRREFMREKMTICAGKRIFITKSGKLGLAPARVEIGDCICVLHGSKVPVVLRKFLTNAGAQKLFFQVVGQCYLEDAMYGEAFAATANEAEVLDLY
jgi:hypothetical protein